MGAVLYPDHCQPRSPIRALVRMQGVQQGASMLPGAWEARKGKWAATELGASQTTSGPLFLAPPPANLLTSSPRRHSTAASMGRFVVRTANDEPQRLERVLDAKSRLIGVSSKLSEVAMGTRVTSQARAPRDRRADALHPTCPPAGRQGSFGPPSGGEAGSPAGRAQRRSVGDRVDCEKFCLDHAAACGDGGSVPPSNPPTHTSRAPNHPAPVPAP